MLGISHWQTTSRTFSRSIQRCGIVEFRGLYTTGGETKKAKEQVGEREGVRERENHSKEESKTCIARNGVAGMQIGPFPHTRVYRMHGWLWRRRAVSSAMNVCAVVRRGVFQRAGKQGKGRYSYRTICCQLGRPLLARTVFKRALKSYLPPRLRQEEQESLWEVDACKWK